MKIAPIEFKTATKPAKKDKGMSKGAIVSRLGKLLDEMTDVEAALAAYKEMNVQDKFGGDVVAKVFECIAASDGELKQPFPRFSKGQIQR